ncbi:MAG: hypothetical protein R2815_06320 [Flavobacteriales bacterium]|nr:hypothetical protein [Flavobacteriales bacterium]
MSNGTRSVHEQVLEALRTKSCMKQDVFERTTAMFSELKQVVEEIATVLEKEASDEDRRLKVEFKDKGATACELRVAGDVIIFHMHTNIFKLDQSNALWKGSYLQDDEMRGYFGVVNIYNFLNDSFKYNRERDLGYLVARLFLNKEGHFFMQGKRQLSFLFNDLATSELDRDRLMEVIYTVIDYVLQFDLLAPPYDQVNQVTVSEINELNSNLQMSTGKRLGFRFQADVDEHS